MKLALLLAALTLAGCACPDRYVSGQRFGDSGRTACLDAQGNPTRQLVDGTVPWCDYPADGDGF